jgi:predicted nucleic acid-binding protein
LIVIDASAVVALLLRLPGSDAIKDRLSETDELVAAPHLIDAEVVHAIRRYVAAGHASAWRGSQAIDDFSDIEIQRYPHAALLGRVWDLRGNLTAYDAMYVALAELLEAPLMTRDRRLAAAPGHLARVEVI